MCNLFTSTQQACYAYNLVHTFTSLTASRTAGETCHSVFTFVRGWWLPTTGPPTVPRVYLEVCGTLEGLPADATAVDALLPVHLLAVVHEHGGWGEGALTVQALVWGALLFRLAVGGQLGRDVSHLERVTSSTLLGKCAPNARQER